MKSVKKIKYMLHFFHQSSSQCWFSGAEHELISQEHKRVCQVVKWPPNTDDCELSHPATESGQTHLIPSDPVINPGERGGEAGQAGRQGAGLSNIGASGNLISKSRNKAQLGQPCRWALVL